MRITPIDPEVLDESKPITYEQFIAAQKKGAEQRAENFAKAYPTKAAEGDDRADWRTYVSFMDQKSAAIYRYVHYYNQWLTLLPHGYEHVLTVYSLLPRDLVWDLYDIGTDYQMDNETFHFRKFLDQVTDIHYFGERLLQIQNNKQQKLGEVWIRKSIEIGLLTDKSKRYVRTSIIDDNLS